MEKRFDALCVGMALVNFPIFPVEPSIFECDVNPVDAIELMPGGDAANQAIILSRLGNRVAVMSKRGDDSFGQILEKLLRTEGRDIDLSGMVKTADHATCVCAMMIRPDGQRSFCTHRGALNTLCLDDLDEALIRQARLVSIGGLMTLPAFDGDASAYLFRTAKEAGAITVADTKKDLWGIGLKGIAQTLAYTDYFFPSLLEAQDISGEAAPERAARVFLEMGAKKVGIKLGDKGCYFTDGKTEFHLPAYPTHVVDTTGAGDNFMAGFNTGLLRGLSDYDACKLGAKCGALCVQQLGPIKAVQSLEQVMAYGA